MSSPHRIVILGAGFGGIHTYLALHRARAGRDLKLTLVNRTNYFLFSPLLHEVATGGLSHHNVVDAVRNIMSQDEKAFMQADVTGIDATARVVHTNEGDIPYNTLVIALGASTNYYGIPGAEEHGLVLKTLADAITLRNRLIDVFEQAARVKDHETRTKMLSFAVVGGGPTGVETVSEMADLFRDTFAPMYAGIIKPEEMKLTLVTQDKELLLPLPANQRGKALEILKKLGVEVSLNSAVKEVTADGLRLNDETMIQATTVVWAAGVTPKLPPITPPLVTDRGRLVVDTTLRVQDHPEIYAIGDAAACMSMDGKTLPMLAQVAVRQGPIVAQNILRTLDQQPLRSFEFRSKGNLVSVGRFQALATIGPFHLSGPLAWFIWRTVYLFNFTSWSKRFKIGADWFVNLFSPRDITRA